MAELSQSTELTTLLNAWTSGDTRARDELFSLVYPEVKAIARRYRGRGAPYTLQATEIVHEAYLRLAGQELFGWQHRGQFFKLASRLVRQVLVDHARGKMARKRGSDVERSPIGPDEVAESGSEVDLLVLDDALRRLAEFDPLAARIVELRHFGGFTISETARALETGTATISRRWQVAQAWLRRELEPTEPSATGQDLE